jgi:hypothetical protein
MQISPRPALLALAALVAAGVVGVLEERRLSADLARNSRTSARLQRVMARAPLLDRPCA